MSAISAGEIPKPTEFAALNAKVNGVYGDEELIIKTAFQVYYQALSFNERDGIHSAEATAGIVITGVRDDEITELSTEKHPITIQTRDRNAPSSLQTYRAEMSLPVDDTYSRYIVYLSINDNNSDSQYIKELHYKMPEQSGVVSISDISFFEISNGRARGVASDYVSLSADSINVTYFVRLNRSNYPVRIETRFEKIRSDTSYAALLGVPPVGSSLLNRGVDLSNSQNIAHFTHTHEESGLKKVSVKLPALSLGLYNVNVGIYPLADTEKEPIASDSKKITIRSASFPSLRTVRELAKPLAYLMNESEYENMMSLDSDEAIKEKMDEFWLNNLRNPNRARDVINLYYERVEEANLMFSNFKEGWMTDKGKLYILYGPPYIVERSLNRLAWMYSNNPRDMRYVYILERPSTFDRDLPYDHYVLQRRRVYQEMEYERVQDWLNGRVLFRSY